MREPAPFHLGRGAAGPVQQSRVSCGSAALTVARMLVSPQFARWIVNGAGPRDRPPDSRSEQDRFAEYERTVMHRTNGIGPAVGWTWNVPWPRALGTPPWGARRELEYGAARPAAAYAIRLVRFGSGDALRAAHRDLLRVVGEGLPALLYIGNAWLPRHVTLVLPGSGPDGDGRLDVYDPATGSVTELDRERFAARTLEIAGWDVPWITVQPR
ncbi:MAG: hypothetical protein ABIP19_10075 [Dermatophilaceae bacterium]